MVELVALLSESPAGIAVVLLAIAIFALLRSDITISYHGGRGTRRRSKPHWRRSVGEVHRRYPLMEPVSGSRASRPSPRPPPPPRSPG